MEGEASRRCGLGVGQGEPDPSPPGALARAVQVDVPVVGLQQVVDRVPDVLGEVLSHQAQTNVAPRRRRGG